MEQIKIPCTLWDGAELISGEDDTVILHDNHIEFIYKFKYEYFKDEDNQALGREVVSVDTEAVVHRSMIQTIELKRNDKEKVYKVSVYCAPRTNSIYFKSRKEAKEFKDKLIDWMFK